LQLERERVKKMVNRIRTAQDELEAEKLKAKADLEIATAALDEVASDESDSEGNEAAVDQRPDEAPIEHSSDSETESRKRTKSQNETGTVFKCSACRKVYKSQGQWDAHTMSKAHLKAVQAGAGKKAKVQ
jgi:uncharacterized C2H2 Zn-finger protein